MLQAEVYLKGIMVAVIFTVLVGLLGWWEGKRLKKQVSKSWAANELDIIFALCSVFYWVLIIGGVLGNIQQVMTAWLNPAAWVLKYGG